MTSPEEWELHLCMLLQNPLGALHNICLGNMEQYVGFRLPTGEVVSQAVLFAVGPAMLKKAEEILANPDSGLLLVSAEVERQVELNKLCLALEVRTGETSAQYYALSECQLIRKEQ